MNFASKLFHSKSILCFTKLSFLPNTLIATSSTNYNGTPEAEFAAFLICFLNTSLNIWNLSWHMLCLSILSFYFAFERGSFSADTHNYNEILHGGRRGRTVTIVDCQLKKIWVWITRTDNLWPPGCTTHHQPKWQHFIQTSKQGNHSVKMTCKLSKAMSLLITDIEKF